MYRDAIRVVLISPCMGRYGGLEAFVLTVAGGVAALPGFEVKVVFKEAGAFALHEDLAERIRSSRVKVEFCDRLSRRLWSAVRRADLVHLQNPCPDVLLMARLARKPVLVNVINHLGHRGGLHERLWRWGLRSANRRFYISEFVRRTWEKTAEPWPGSHVVFPICQLSSLEPLPVEARRGFVFVARWIENKGLDTLVEAYAQAGLDPEQWPLQLLGDGPLRPRIERRISELGLSGVEMPGFVSESEKAERIRRSRFVVIPPNTREDFGLVAIEARYLGVPCLITRDGGLPEAAGPQAWICEPGDIDGLADLLRRASALPLEEYARLAAQGKKCLTRDLTSPDVYARTYQAIMRPSAPLAN